ncbi:MAG TPA: cytochrome c oxidase subunit II [Rhodanobacteraceae bacterium]|nr:cytochrome c oxidase subunit II [Rhodanobacteraceae bacterium]
MRRASGIALALLLSPLAAQAAPMGYLSTHGASANPITSLGWGLLVLSLFVVAFISLAVLVGIWWKRRGPLDEAGWPVLSRGRNGMPWLLVGVPVSIVLLCLSALWTFFALAAVASPPGNPPITLDITGHQWWWEVKYEYYGKPELTFVTANEIHLPVGQPVRVRLKTADVIHSFWVPKLAGKTDLIPGQTNIAWLEADKAGIYRGQCGEFCGLQHAHMALYVVAQPAQAFRSWWDHQLSLATVPATAKALHGSQVFQSRCAICHTVRGLGGSQGGMGPDLTHLMSRRTIAAGTLPNKVGYLAAWISNAQAIKPGAGMPTESLSSEQLQALLAYVQSLH